MAQWTNLQRIEKFENPMRLYIHRVKILEACTWSYGRVAGWLADKIWARPEILKLAAD